MTPILASNRLDWANAIGLFITNFGMLEWQVFVFLESRVSPDLFAKLKGKHFKDRIALVQSALNQGAFSCEQKQRFETFFNRLERMRELRNHIAHGHLLVRCEKGGKNPVETLSLPKDLDAIYQSETRHVEFEELEAALGELTALIEEFRACAGAGAYDYFHVREHNDNDRS
jgi:hypothetical protein